MRQFDRFVKIFELIQQTPSLTLAHVSQILQWRNESQTKKRSHKYSDQDICARAQLYWNKNQQIIQQKNGDILRDSTPNKKSILFLII